MLSCTVDSKKNDEIKQDKKAKFKPITNPTNKVVLSSEIVWEKLNPARGDRSPQAGTIWGDRKSGTPKSFGNKERGVPTGFLAKFVDGFSSPPHIHNVTYRAVVIKGMIHNDDEKAENMWMKPGSFWTQPKGKAHITSAKGQENIAYVEIDHGPYLVKPTSEAVESDEQPINIDVSNLVWLDTNETNWITSDKNAEISFLWENKKDKGMRGLFVKLPNKFKGVIESTGNAFHSVVISGKLNYIFPQNSEVKILDPGSYFTSQGDANHVVNTESEVVLYVRTNGSVIVN